MNKSSLLGIIAAVVVFLASILTATDERGIFLDPHGILIVIGGTLAASMICFPVKTVVSMVKVVFHRILGKNKMAVKNSIHEIVELSKGQRTNPKYLVENVDNIENPSAVVGYRDGDVWYNATGLEISDPTLLADAAGGKIAPYLINPDDATNRNVKMDAF